MAVSLTFFVCAVLLLNQRNKIWGVSLISWVLVDGYVYDLTSDQFDGIDAPLIGAIENILAARFTIAKSSPLQDFLNGSHLGSEAQQLNAIHLLKTDRGLHD